MRVQAARWAAFSAWSRVGTLPSIGETSCGLVPQVTIGGMSGAFSETSVSYRAPSSDGRVFQ